jgi:hypothetical protein
MAHVPPNSRSTGIAALNVHGTGLVERKIGPWLFAETRVRQNSARPRCFLSESTSGKVLRNRRVLAQNPWANKNAET